MPSASRIGKQIRVIASHFYPIPFIPFIPLIWPHNTLSKSSSTYHQRDISVYTFVSQANILYNAIAIIIAIVLGFGISMQPDCCFIGQLKQFVQEIFDIFSCNIQFTPWRVIWWINFGSRQMFIHGDWRWCGHRRCHSGICGRDNWESHWRKAVESGYLDQQYIKVDDGKCFDVEEKFVYVEV